MKNIRANLTDKVYPDYCVGFLYSMVPDTALGIHSQIILIIISSMSSALAQTSLDKAEKLMPKIYFEDYLITGFLRKKTAAFQLQECSNC